MKIYRIISTIVKILLVPVVLFVIIVLLPIQPPKEELTQTGVTFSTRASEFLGLDWKENFEAMLSDLHPDLIRIPVYWNRLEPEQGNFHWDDFDYQLQRLSETETKVILAVGAKLPRWPECHIPKWAQDLPEEQVDAALMNTVEAVVTRYKDYPLLYAWQAGNEVLFPFGECPSWVSKRSRIKTMIEKIRSLDPNTKLITTDSGEMSTWLRTSTLPIDSLGISLYRVSFNSWYGYFHWPVNPYFYRIHKWFVSPWVDEMLITELQLEPWGPETTESLSEEEIEKSITPNDLRDRVEYASRTGIPVVLGWGVEWWYYMKEVRDNPEYWDAAVKLFN